MCERHPRDPDKPAAQALAAQGAELVPGDMDKPDQSAAGRSEAPTPSSAFRTTGCPTSALRANGAPGPRSGGYS